MKKLLTLFFALTLSMVVFAASNDNDFVQVNESVLTFTTTKQIKQMSVYSMLGGCVMVQNGSDNEMVISTLPNGFYLLKVITDKGILTYKFMKN